MGFLWLGFCSSAVFFFHESVEMLIKKFLALAFEFED